MCVCSAITSESKPRSSMARASVTVSMVSSFTNVEIPIFICTLNCRPRGGQRRRLQGYSPGTRALCQRLTIFGQNVPFATEHIQALPVGVLVQLCACVVIPRNALVGHLIAAVTTGNGIGRRDINADAAARVSL